MKNEFQLDVRELIPKLKEFIDKHLLIILIGICVILVILIMMFSFSAGWSFGYVMKVESVNKPMIKSLGNNCEPAYVRRKVLPYSSITMGLFRCADINESYRAHLRVLFAHTRIVDDIYGTKGAGYTYDCLTGAIKSIWPYPLNDELLFTFNVSLAQDFCKLDIAYNMSLIQIEGCNDCYDDITFYGFDDFGLTESLNYSND